MKNPNITLGLVLAVIALTSGLFGLIALESGEAFNGKHILALIEVIAGSSYILFGDVCLTCWRNRE